MKFWDSSAVTPLLVQEKDSALRKAQIEEDPLMTVWYGTQVEVESALARKRRDEELSSKDLRVAKDQLRIIAKEWDEVVPTERMKERAIRCLHTHALRAADAFQLAAALLASGEHPQQHAFYNSDLRLREAAEREGFEVE